MNYSAVEEELISKNRYEEKAFDYLIRHGKRAKNAQLLEIYDFNVFDFIPKSLYDSYIKTRNPDLIPKYIVYNERFAFEKNENISVSKADRYIEIFPLKHDYYEIEYMLSGSSMIYVQGQELTLSNGNIAIIPPNVIYQAIPDDDSVLINLKIRKNSFDKIFINLLSADTVISAYFSKTLYSKAYRTAMLIRCSVDEFIKNIFLNMYYQQQSKNDYYQQMLEGLSVTLLSYLMQNYGKNIEMTNTVISNDDRVMKIAEYINSNYKTVTLTDVADKFYMSQSYLSVFIKKELGVNFSQLLKEIKMTKASTLLITTDMKVEEICLQSGYEDTTQFIKTFKNFYGMSPKMYRNFFRT
ncbi:MAG: AraC family transcriptional regulator [Eubacterium sp.]